LLDLKIVGGTIIDGSGGAPFGGSIGIKGDRIVAIGDVEEDAAEVIDATGRVVSPGFVDVHTHYDAQAFWDPTFSPSCYHGVTTILGGFCGFSIAPLSPESGAYLLPMLARVEGMPEDVLKAGVPWDWHTFGDFLSRLDGRVLLNAGFFVGHSAVRRLVMGERANAGEATTEEVAAMQGWVDRSLQEGALGFSSTVSPSHNDGDGNPVPSRYASRDELLTLMGTVRNHEGTSLELLPDLLAFEEEGQADLLVDCSLAGGRSLNWNVLTVGDGGDADRKRIASLLQPSRIARQKGAEVLALTFASAQTLRVNFVSGFVFDSIPGWGPLFRLPLDRRLEALKDPFIREPCGLRPATRSQGRSTSTTGKSTSSSKPSHRKTSASRGAGSTTSPESLASRPSIRCWTSSFQTSCALRSCGNPAAMMPLDTSCGVNCGTTTMLSSAHPTLVPTWI